VEKIPRADGMTRNAHSAGLSRAPRREPKPKCRGAQGKFHPYTDAMREATEDGEHERQGVHLL